jgi:hypothetical protein
MEHVEGLHLRLNPEDIPELKIIISTNQDNATRERAIYVLADIAIRHNNSEQVVGFLKEIAYTEENTRVKTAAVANVYLIREVFPIDKKGELNIQVEGTVKKGNNITIIGVVSSSVNVPKASFGIKRIAGDEGIKIYHNPTHFSLNAGEEKRIPLTIYLEEYGKYYTLAQLKLNFDQIDYQTLEKGILIRFDQKGGTYHLLDTAIEDDSIDYMFEE